MADDSRLSRRKALAAGGSVAALALAGCAAEEGEEGNTTADGDGSQQALTPPDAPPVPDDQYWAYVVESLEYQNDALRRLTED